MKKVSDYNAFEKSQHACGVALARAQWGYNVPAAIAQWGDSLQPNEADLDSSAFARGYADKIHWMGMEPFDDDMECVNLFAEMLDLGGNYTERTDYHQQLRQLDPELFHALLGFADQWERDHDNDIVEEPDAADSAMCPNIGRSLDIRSRCRRRE